MVRGQEKKQEAEGSAQVIVDNDERVPSGVPGVVLFFNTCIPSGYPPR